MIINALTISRDELRNRTGWDIKPQGACKGEVCIPLPSQVTTPAGLVDITKLSEKLQMPIIQDKETGVWCVGPEAGTSGTALTTALAPDFELPDWQGRPFHLHDLRGKKVLLLTWASW